MSRRVRRPQSPRARRFNAPEFLHSSGVSQKILTFQRRSRIFSQGELALDVYYIEEGTVRLSVTSSAGKEAVIALLGSGDFFGEGSLAGQPRRMGSATAMTACRVVSIARPEMMHLLHDEPEFADRFLGHLLGRNIRIEEDLVDQLFNSAEKRVARALLLLARYGKDDEPMRTIPKLTQEMLADMVGTTRSRVNFFMNKFRKLGFIEYNGGIVVRRSLLSVVLHE